MVLGVDCAEVVSLKKRSYPEVLAPQKGEGTAKSGERNALSILNERFTNASDRVGQSILQHHRYSTLVLQRAQISRKNGITSTFRRRKCLMILRKTASNSATKMESSSENHAHTPRSKIVLLGERCIAKPRRRGARERRKPRPGSKTGASKSGSRRALLRQLRVRTGNLRPHELTII